MRRGPCCRGQRGRSVVRGSVNHRHRARDAVAGHVDLVGHRIHRHCSRSSTRSDGRGAVCSPVARFRKGARQSGARQQDAGATGARQRNGCEINWPLQKCESAAIEVVFGLVELIEAGRGFVDLKGLFVLRPVYGACKVPIGVEELGGGTFDSFQAQPLRSIAVPAH